MTPRAPTSDIPLLIPGSTREILVGLMVNLLKINGLTTENNHVGKVANLDALAANTGRKLFTLPDRLSSTAEGIRITIERLGAAKETKDLVSMYEPTLKTLTQTSISLKQQHDQLKGEYSRLVSEQTQRLREWLMQDVGGNRPDPRLFEELTSKQAAFKRSVDDFIAEHKKTQRELNTLQIEAYARVKDKSNLPVPAQERIVVRERHSP